MQRARALMPEAELAIPEEWGKLLCVLMLRP